MIDLALYLREMERITRAKADAELRAQTVPVDIDGVKYWPGQPNPILPPPVYHAPTIQLSTLDALLEWYERDIDETPDSDPLDRYIHIASPTVVDVLKAAQGGRRERFTEARATAIVPEGLPLGRYLPVEEAVIQIQYLFQETDDRARLLAIAGHLKAEQEMVTADDGATQVVTTRKGIAPGRETVVQPFHLTPFRTFAEIDQPESPYILRFRGNAESGAQLALFEADGGAWRLQAIKAIREYITTRATEPIVIS